MNISVSNSETHKEFNNKIITTTKYANIRIVGEKEERQIKWETYLKIKNLPEDFDGSVEIEELGLILPRKQIVKMEEKEDVEVEYKNFTNLPTETIMLDKDFHILNKNRIAIEREYDEYYIATCHFAKNDEEKQYYTNKDQIKRLVLMKKDLENIGYPHFVAKTCQYGI